MIVQSGTAPEGSLLRASNCTNRPEDTLCVCLNPELPLSRRLWPHSTEVYYLASRISMASGHPGPEYSKSTWRRSSSANGHRIRLATRPPATRKTMCPRRSRRARLTLRRAPRAAGALVCGRRFNRCARLSVLTSSDRQGSALSDLAAGRESRQGFGSRRARSREEPSCYSSRRLP
jgi:hypothetical protein